MRKDDLIRVISDQTGLTRHDVRIVIESLFSVIKDQVTQGDYVTIRGFGTFFQKVRKPRVGRDIHRNRPVVIPERRVPAFRPSPRFVDQVNTSSSKQS